MKIVLNMAFYLFVLGVLAACGKKEEPAQPVAKPEPAAAAEVVLVPSGNSGLIPSAAGLLVFDAAKLVDPKPRRSACAVDKVNGDGDIAMTEFSQGANIEFSGWILTPNLKSPESFAVLLLGKQKSYAILGAAGGRRLDVAKAFKSKAASRSGYNVPAKLDAVDPGEYEISLLQDSNGIVSVCTTKHRIRVTQ